MILSVIVTTVLWAVGSGLETALDSACPMVADLAECPAESALGKKSNPLPCVLLQDAPLPLFDQVKAEDVVPGITQLIKELNEEVDELEKHVEPTWSGLVEPLEKLTDRLSRAWSTVSHLKVPPWTIRPAWKHAAPCWW